MNKKEALRIAKDRIESMKQFVPSNQSEAKIAKETTEWLIFIEKLLEEEN